MASLNSYLLKNPLAGLICLLAPMLLHTWSEYGGRLTPQSHPTSPAMHQQSYGVPASTLPTATRTELNWGPRGHQDALFAR